MNNEELRTKEELSTPDIKARFISEGRLIRIDEVGHEQIYLELDEARELRDWLVKVLQ